MTTALLQQSLDALEGVLDDAKDLRNASISGGCYEVVQCRDAIRALREAIAQPVQPASKAQPEREDAEPVAMAEASGEIVWVADEYPLNDTPLYLGPPNRRS